MEGNSIACPGEISTLSTWSAVTLAVTHSCHGIFSGLTMTSMTGGWYHRISPIESVLLGVVILQIFVLRYLEILPIDVNHFLHQGLFSGKRKRRNIPETTEEKLLLETFFALLRRIDQYDCLLRAICEIHAYNSQLETELKQKQYKIQTEMVRTVEALERYGLMREKYTEKVQNNLTIEERPMVSVFEEATLCTQRDDNYKTQQYNFSNIAKNYKEDTHRKSSCLCSLKYSLCPLSTDELLNSVVIAK